MLTPKDFIARWENRPGSAIGVEIPERFVHPPESILQELSISPHDEQFLREAGLPEDAAPFLSFHEVERGLPRIYEYWGIQGDWDDEDKAYLEPYRAIGADGSGNPICIDKRSGGRLVFLDHDDWFQTVLFVNTGIIQLAEFLLAYREMVFESLASGGPDAFITGAIPTKILERAIATMRASDPAPIEDGTFWSGELNCIRSA